MINTFVTNICELLKDKQTYCLFMLVHSTLTNVNKYNLWF